MKTHWSIKFKSAAAVGILLLALSGVVVIRARATASSGLTNVQLARGNDTSDGTIPLQVGTDIVMSQITVVPGGSSGWHSHPGGAIVVVSQGSLTVYRSIGSQCEITTYGAQQAFVERPGEVDQVINTGTIPYVLFVTFPHVPQGESPRIDQPDPGTCPAL